MFSYRFVPITTDSDFFAYGMELIQKYAILENQIMLTLFII